MLVDQGSRTATHRLESEALPGLTRSCLTALLAALEEVDCDIARSVRNAAEDERLGVDRS